MKGLRLTQRGKVVALSAAFAASFIVGMLTADWNWYGI